MFTETTTNPKSCLRAAEAQKKASKLNAAYVRKRIRTRWEEWMGYR